MLPKNKRINLKKNFQWVSSGEKKETQSLKLKYKLGNNKTALVGIAISSHIFKKANIRNKIKREISKAVETLYPFLKNNLNLIIMPKESSLEKNIQTLEKELKNVKDLYSDN